MLMKFIKLSSSDFIPPFSAQIQKLKHSVPKGDKKKKKEVTDQIAKLEAEQVARHEHEVSTFTQDDEVGKAKTLKFL